MTITLSPSQLTQQVYDRLALTLTAFVADTPNRADVHDWRNGISEPGEAQRQRLTVALEVFNTVSTRDGDDRARAVMVGSGAVLNNKRTSPAAAIRAGEFDAARKAAQGYLEDAPI